jgi:predicted dehydrogenase
MNAHLETPTREITPLSLEDDAPRLRLAFAGAGMRSTAYATAAAEIPGVEVVAVAEPRPRMREKFCQAFGVPVERAFTDWRDLVSQPVLADAVVIGLQDGLHRDAAIAFAERGYDILLEKPIAPTEEDCDAIELAARAAGVTISICHVLRYTPYTRALKRLLDDDVIGEIVNVEHLEPIGNTHFAHSYVRGNWRREDESSSLLLSKSCHDIDWLLYIVGKPIRRVSSFGSLTQFRAEARPEGAAARCIDCPLQSTCIYSAPRYYHEALRAGDHAGHYVASVITGGDVTAAGVDRALADGPYGRCVWASDNDVVDHQVVQMEFDDGVLASFTMTAFSEGANRKTRIFGTKGQITGDGQHIEIYDFFTQATTRIDTHEGSGHSAADGHGGGDSGLMRDFVAALHAKAPESLSSTLHASMASHRVVFAAERARKAGVVEVVAEPIGALVSRSPMR